MPVMIDKKSETKFGVLQPVVVPSDFVNQYGGLDALSCEEMETLTHTLSVPKDKLTTARFKVVSVTGGRWIPSFVEVLEFIARMSAPAHEHNVLRAYFLNFDLDAPLGMGAVRMTDPITGREDIFLVFYPYHAFGRGNGFIPWATPCSEGL
jgi:hypothetical protein